MKTMQAHTMNLAGTSYEIGYGLGKMYANIPPLRALHTQGAAFGDEKIKEAADLFDRWCPGLTNELHGFADALEVPAKQIFFYSMTYLLPRCSQVALLPSRTADGKPLVARNYEFSHEAEDFCLVKTAVKGKYAHLGTSVLSFGRDDGLNEHGLSVTQSSCGFPVGALPYMRSPALKGLQFWAVIRALLENCKDVSEALAYLEGMPIAYNVNLLLMDKAGNAALFETLDGRSAFKRIGPDTAEQFLFATNHAVLPELIPNEPGVMVHSAKRYDYIQNRLAVKGGLTRTDLKEMLLSGYPDGLCCHYYEEYFGTTKSMVISPADGTVELCWGGREENGWDTYDISQPLQNGTRNIEISLEKAAPGTYDYQRR
ncbi:MAG TPA: acyl-CoA--6-aminopenicillanic acid acyl-transferase [Ruminococcaceae bacterium]|nr:acyl-CoA--6-aminopenicillanic acid acyl-transferase [Oscillospiraceae bacterium]